MIKKTYEKPDMRVVVVWHQAHLMAGSLKSVQSTGLEEVLELPSDGLPTTGSIWEDAR